MHNNCPYPDLHKYTYSVANFLKVGNAFAKRCQTIPIVRHLFLLICSMQPLTISLIQSNLYWEDKAKNLEQFAAKFGGLPKETQIVFLPEMFSTGFSMKPQELAETMDGPTVQWMKDMSRKHRKII